MISFTFLHACIEKYPHKPRWHFPLMLYGSTGLPRVQNEAEHQARNVPKAHFEHMGERQGILHVVCTKSQFRDPQRRANGGKAGSRHEILAS